MSTFPLKGTAYLRQDAHLLRVDFRPNHPPVTKTLLEGSTMNLSTPSVVAVVHGGSKVLLQENLEAGVGKRNSRLFLATIDETGRIIRPLQIIPIPVDVSYLQEVPVWSFDYRFALLPVVRQSFLFDSMTNRILNLPPNMIQFYWLRDQSAFVGGYWYAFEKPELFLFEIKQNKIRSYRITLAQCDHLVGAAWRRGIMAANHYNRGLLQHQILRGRHHDVAFVQGIEIPGMLVLHDTEPRWDYLLVEPSGMVVRHELIAGRSNNVFCTSFVLRDRYLFGQSEVSPLYGYRSEGIAPLILLEPMHWKIHTVLSETSGYALFQFHEG